MKINYIYLFLIAFFGSCSAISYADQDKAYLNKKLREQNQVLILENKILKKNIEVLTKQIKNLMADNQNNHSFNHAPSDSLAINGSLNNKPVSIKPNRNGFSSFSDHFLKEQLAYQDTQIKILTAALQREKLNNVRELSFSPASSFIISAIGSWGIEKPVSYYVASFTIDNSAKSSNSSPFPESSVESLRIQYLEEELRGVRGQLSEDAGTSAETEQGQTPVWTPLDSITFIHTAFLKNQPAVSDQPLKEILRDLKTAYDEIREQPVVTAARGALRLPFTTAMNQLDPEDPSTFENMFTHPQSIINFTTGRAGLDALHQFFERAREVYATFQVEQQQQIPGLERYAYYQRKLEEITQHVRADGFMTFMDEFDLKKKAFTRRTMDFLEDHPASRDNPSYYALLDKIAFEMSDKTLGVFNNAFTVEPERSSRNYNDHPFVLLQRTVGSRTMDTLDFYARHNRAGTIVNNPLSERNPFTRLKQMVRGGDWRGSTFSDSDIDVVEKMYIFQRSQRLFSTNHWSDEPLRTRIGQEALLSQNVKNTLSSLLEPDRRFLQRELATHALTLKKLDEELKPVLSYKQTAPWAGKEDLRETLSEIYTNYRNMVTIGTTLYKKHPKIREFHEEE